MYNLNREVFKQLLCFAVQLVEVIQCSITDVFVDADFHGVHRSSLQSHSIHKELLSHHDALDCISVRTEWMLVHKGVQVSTCIPSFRHKFLYVFDVLVHV